MGIESANEPATLASQGFVPWRYPSNLECTITARNKATFRLRPIGPDDAPALLDFHRRLSSDSIYRRYFSIHPSLSPNEVSHLTHVDYVARLALVIEDESRLIAVGRYERYPTTSDAEVAFIVADDFQGIGLGPILLEHLARAAWERGITTFLAETLAGNHDMMSVFNGCGFPVTSTYEDQEICLRIAIEPTDAVRARSAQRPDQAKGEDPPC